LRGALLSFAGKHEAAEWIFRHAQGGLNLEICPEIKVHRLLFSAEHATRGRDWDEVGSIIRKVQDLWAQQNNDFQAYLKKHFKTRIEALMLAVSSRMSIDESNFESEEFSCSGSHDSCEPSLTGSPRSPSLGWSSPGLLEAGPPAPIADQLIPTTAIRSPASGSTPSSFSSL
jgi:hypothetical protein